MSLTKCLTPLALLLAVSGCAAKERIRPFFPPAADLAAATEPKPIVCAIQSATAKLRPLDVERPCCDAGYAYETWLAQCAEHDAGRCRCADPPNIVRSEN